MVLRISEVLDVPLRHRNELLASVGPAAVYADLPLTSVDLDAAREARQRILRHHEPIRRWSLRLPERPDEELRLYQDHQSVRSRRGSATS